MKFLAVFIFVLICVIEVSTYVVVHNEGKSIQAKDGNFTIQPRDGSLSIQPQDGNFTIQPRTDDCKCGLNKYSRIVGGIQATLNEFSYMVAVCYGACSKNTQFCGATLINDLYCLSAAHCFEDGDENIITLSFGDHSMASTTEIVSITRSVEWIKKHPHYNDITQANDIAIIKLSAPVPINNKIRPACLPTTNTVQYTNKSAIATGWGLTSSGGSPSAVLREVNVTVMNNKICRERYSQEAITNGMLCAGTENKDSCQGDSGGPLCQNVNGKQQLIGITSWGYGCGSARYPGVYTRVATYLNFINDWAKGGKKCI